MERSGGNTEGVMEDVGAMRRKEEGEVEEENKQCGEGSVRLREEVYRREPPSGAPYANTSC